MAVSIIEGIRFYSEKKYEDALAFFLGISSSKDLENESDIAYYTGLCYTRLERFNDALNYLEQIVTGENSDIARVYQCRLILALIYAKTGRSRLAEFELTKLIEAGYESVQVFASMGFVLYEHGDVENAVVYYEQALKLDKENSTAANSLGYILADADKDLTQALIFCKKAVDKNPENPAYLDSLAWVYLKMGSVIEARTYIKRAREKLPENEIIKKHAEIIMSKKNEVWQ